jgi:cysteine desulfurase/selenocysteine lyase
MFNINDQSDRLNDMNNNPFLPEQIEQFRSDTPATNQKVHFNNAGASLPVKAVLDTIMSYLHEESMMGGYEAEAKYQAELNNTYQLIGRLINAEPEEIALVENASAAWCTAFYGIDFQPGDEVLISEMEYVTNMIGFLNGQKLFGIGLVIIPNDERGNFSLENLEAAISQKTKLIAITQVASATGGILPVEAIGRIASKYDILYLLDGCQSVGQMPVDVKAIGCDFLSVTGRKYLRAPRGTGFLYVKRKVQNSLKTLFIDGHSIEWINENAYQSRNDAKRFEFYEKNRALTLGLGVAVSYALNIGVDKIWQRISYLADLLRSNLAQIDGLTIHDTGDQLCGIVTFSVAGIESQAIKLHLTEQNINVSVAQAKSTLLFMNKHSLQSIVRASVHYYNTELEIQLLCNVIKELTLSSSHAATEILKLSIK